MEEKDIEKTKIRIPSFKLSRDILQELFGIIEKEKTDGSRLTYILDSTKREITSHNSENFLDYGIPKDWEKFTFELLSQNKEIKVNIEMQWLNSYFTISGVDPTWVNGITKRLEEIFEKYKTKNDLYSSSILVVVFCIPICSALYLLLMSTLSNRLDNVLASLIISVLGGGLIAFICFSALLAWLFPPVETEHTVQLKYRKAIIVIIEGLVVSVIAFYLVKFLPQ